MLQQFCMSILIDLVMLRDYTCGQLLPFPEDWPSRSRQIPRFPLPLNYKVKMPVLAGAAFEQHASMGFPVSELSWKDEIACEQIELP
jgi:hypothetical protein